MALNEPRHCLFIGCRNPARMLGIDAESREQLAVVEMAGDTNDLFYDASKGRIYAPAAAGLST